MTHRQRIEAAIRGQPTDRLPVALWRHFPYADQTAEGLAEAVLAFQSAYELDLVKVTHTSGYPAEAWGAELEHADNEEGTRRYLKRPVTSPEDWHGLLPLDPNAGILGRELAALRLIRQGIGPDVPLMPTIFSPLTVAKQLAGQETMMAHLSRHPADLEAGLSRIADFCRRFAQACLENGADAIFFATQFARHGEPGEATYRRFGVPYDLAVLDALRDQADMILLHLHGDDPIFGLAAEYGVDIVNWHDRETVPSLDDGQAAFDGAVLGGLARAHLAGATPQEVAAQARDAVAQTDGRRFILGAGCVTLTTTPAENIAAAVAVATDT